MDPGSLQTRLRLIVITDAQLAAPRTVLHIVEAALHAGAPAVQLRDKSASARDLAETGRALLTLTRAADALLFINDRLDVALAVGADGVHVGPDDLPVEAVRRCAPEGFLVGSSTDEPRIARELVRGGADYIGCGAVWPTETKRNAGASIGLPGLQHVVESVDVPVVAIGGIDGARAAEIATHTNAAGVAVVGAVMAARDVKATVEELLSPWPSL
jgi:thiamine-phosphate pyrophosphorylase